MGATAMTDALLARARAMLERHEVTVFTGAQPETVPHVRLDHAAAVLAEVLHTNEVHALRSGAVLLENEKLKAQRDALTAILTDLVAVDTQRHDNDYYLEGMVEIGFVEPLQERARAALAAVRGGTDG
jgi:hypothetical protein